MFCSASEDGLVTTVVRFGISVTIKTKLCHVNNENNTDA